MFGTFRFCLASLVMIGHLSGFPPFSYFGMYAVFGFYVVSGYVMTAILRTTYGFSAKGSVRFWANRLLRLFPAYYCVALLSLGLILAFPGPAGRFHDLFVTRFRALDLLGNLFLFPYPFYHQRFRLVPPSWSLGVELSCYVLLWLFTARGVACSAVSFGLACGYAAYTAVAGLEWSARYYPVRAAILPFSIGSLLFFYHVPIQRALAGRLGLAIAATAAALFINLGVAFIPPRYAHAAGFYVNLGLMTCLVAELASIDHVTEAARRVDGMLGKLSYPVFLVHWLVAFAITLFWGFHRRRSLALLAVSYPMVIGCALLLVRCLDDPVQRLRTSIRGRQDGLTAGR